MLLLLVLAVAGAPVVTHPDGRSAYVADGDSDAVWLAKPGHRAEKVFDCVWPSALVLDGTTLWAACRGDGVLVSSAGARVEVGAEPVALTLDAQHRELFVALATPREVLVVDLDAHQVTRRRSIDFEPRALALTAAGLMVVPRSRCEVLTLGFGLDPKLDVRRRLEPLLGGYKRIHNADACQNHAALEWKGGALIAATAFFTGMRTDGWSMTFEVGERVSAMAFSDEWTDPTGLCARADALAAAARAPQKGLLVTHIEDGRLDWGVAPLDGLRDGVTGCSATRRGWAVLEEHARSVAFVDAKTFEVRRAALPRSQLDAQLRRGRDLFFANDERISERGLSCQACHPDGREDSTVWRTDALPRQTPMLAGRLEGTAPFNWHGSGKTVEGNLKLTVERLGGKGLSFPERVALARYLREGLRPVPVPVVDEAAVTRGRSVFEDPAVGCATCHPPELHFTDGAVHDVGTVGDAERRARKEALKHVSSLDEDKAARVRTKLDTPSLERVGLTAPYLHDGSAQTLEQVLELTDGRMGDTRALTAEQRADLVAYLRSL